MHVKIIVLSFYEDSNKEWDIVLLNNTLYFFDWNFYHRMNVYLFHSTFFPQVNFFFPSVEKTEIFFLNIIINTFMSSFFYSRINIFFSYISSVSPIWILINFRSGLRAEINACISLIRLLNKSIFHIRKRCSKGH